MINITKEEVIKSLNLLPYEKKWNGLYGNPTSEKYNHLIIWEQDLINGLIFTDHEDAFIIGSRRIVKESTDRRIICEAYYKGEYYCDTHYNKNSKNTYWFIPEEQSEDILFELYLKGCFMEFYHKMRRAEQLIFEGIIKESQSEKHQI